MNKDCNNCKHCTFVEFEHDFDSIKLHILFFCQKKDNFVQIDEKFNCKDFSDKNKLIEHEINC